MDYLRQLGPVVLDHRFRRLTESLLRSAEEIYQQRGLRFRARWASTYTILYNEGPTAIGEIADRLRLTHPGVIGIADEMSEAGVAVTVRDPNDARRRLVELTKRGRDMSRELFAIWKALGDAQKKRFTSAGCDIMAVMERVEDGLAAQPLAVEVLDKVSTQLSRTAAKKTRSRRGAVKAALVLSVLVGAAAPFHRAPAQDVTLAVPLDAATRGQVVNALADSLINSYIYEAKGRMIADSLRAELRSGAYDAISAGDAFALRLNQTLRRLSNDRHLGVSYTRAPRGRRVVVNPDSAARHADSVMNAVLTARTVSPVFSEPDVGVGSARILKGNVGYLDLRGFSGDPAAIQAIDSVMKLFANTDAIIIDLGRNRGGGVPVIQHLSTYFFDKRVHLVSGFRRGMDSPSERWTLDNVPGKRLPKTPVYVLTSRNTVSAAESFTFGLRNHNRITTVGEPTAGGGHFGGFVGLPAGFSFFLPRGRTYNPVTNEGWEAEGLQPDVAVPYEKSLETALGLATRK